jgi:hypothetical protein
MMPALHPLPYPKRTVIIPPNVRCSAAIIIYPFQTQEVRDLAWACFSPPLLRVEDTLDGDSGIVECTLALTPQRRLWLEQLDHNAGELIDYLAGKPTHRLGVYFERLWHFFLLQDPQVELIAHNLPVHHEGRTLGEFDCLYFCHARQCHVHLELAVKYFLGKPLSGAGDSCSEWHDWLGPDTRDRLDLKLNHILQRQILLGDHPIAKARLEALGIGELRKEIGLKGYLFNNKDKPLPPPLAYNNACTLGRWIDAGQLGKAIEKDNAAAYLLIPKMRWLSPVQCNDMTETFNPQELQTYLAQYFAHDTYPLLVAALDSGGAESRRFFVTADHWPDIHSRVEQTGP